MYEKRTYRQAMGDKRFSSFNLTIGESDLWIGYQGDADSQTLRKEGASILRKLRMEILGYEDPQFLSSFIPIQPRREVSSFLTTMFQAAKRANTGPMASVAGAVAAKVGSELKSRFGLSEIVVENGGDLYIDVLKPLKVQLYAPTSKFSGKLSILVDSTYGPIGVCTSSAKLGHSVSLGKADAVMVACSDAALADAFATAYCNKVRRAEDVQKVCKELTGEEGVLSAVVVLDDMLAVGGTLEVST